MTTEAPVSTNPILANLSAFLNPLHAEGEPLPEVEKRPTILTTYRVAQRDTGACMRRGWESLVRFGQPHLFADQLAEFPTEEAAHLAIWYVQREGRFNEAIVLVPHRVDRYNLGGPQVSALLCAIRDTATEQAFAEMGLTDPAARGLAGLRVKGVR